MDMIEAARQYLTRYVVLSDQEFSFLTQMFEIRQFEKKQQVVNAGEVEQYLNFVSKGVALKYFNKKKDEIVTQIAKENDLISCYDSFITNAPSNYSIQTVESSTFISITKKNLDEVFLYSAKMERLGRLLATQQFLKWEDWEYDRMRFDSHERFIRFMQDNGDLLQRVPQKYLASYLNIKPETFSRLKHLLKKR